MNLRINVGDYTTGLLGSIRNNVSSIYRVFELKLFKIEGICMFISIANEETNTFYLAHFEFKDPVNAKAITYYVRTSSMTSQLHRFRGGTES